MIIIFNFCFLLRLIIHFLLHIEYCTNKTITVDTEIVDVTSPFYPLYYPDGVDCFWRVTTDQLSGFLVISFETVSLHYGDDFLTIGVGNEIKDSAVILRLTGNAAPRIVTVKDHELWLRLTTNLWGQISIGFWLQIEWRDYDGI